MSYFKEKKIVVTGGNGFLGRHVVKLLTESGCKNIMIPRSVEYNLIKEADIIRLYEFAKPDIVIHLAASVGGIGANQQNPGPFFYNNAMMGLQLIEQARLFGVNKFVTIGTTCCYPKNISVPYLEKDLWEGYPDEITGYYGLAKKMMLVQSTAYRKQYNFNSLFLMPSNLYGPYDNFDDKSSHVIPAIIKRFVQAKSMGAPSVICWGTGEATREFLYVEDCAKGILQATEVYNSSEPVNLGTGVEVTIKSLTEKIKNLVGYNGSIEWDSTKPEGQRRRYMDVSKAEQYFNFRAEIDIDQGLEKTIDWYLNQDIRDNR
jgi:GDP-L-fucose synthase